jgi:methionyl-tRNA formyltransferase
MKISLLTTNPRHPVVPSLKAWAAAMSAQGHTVQLCHDRAELPGGDMLFLVSCSQIVRASERQKYRATLVLHASDLPRGRGWSPYIWEIAGGASEFTVSLIEASEPVDTGRIWLKTQCRLEGHELLPEIHERLFAAEMELMIQAVERLETLEPQPQHGEPGPYFRRRTPDDSRLDPERSIAEQFDLLRVVDSQRFPAFFEYRGHRYRLTIEKETAS